MHNILPFDYCGEGKEETEWLLLLQIILRAKIYGVFVCEVVCLSNLQGSSHVILTVPESHHHSVQPCSPLIICKSCSPHL